MSLEDSIIRLAETLDKLAVTHEKALHILVHKSAAPAAASAEPAVAPRRGRPPLADKAPPVELTAADLAPSDEPDVAVKYADVRAAVERCVTRKNPAAALAVLETLGVTNAKALKADQYAQAIAALDKA